MTITSSVSTIASAIAALTITGITIKDIDEIPDTAAMLCPVIIPDTEVGYVTDYTVNAKTFGSMGAPKLDSEYVLNYMYIHCEAGSGLGAFAPYAGIFTNLQAVLVAIFTNDVVTGAADVKLQSVSKVGVITDPAGNDFWGVRFSLKVLEMNQ